jgi:NAD(P)-dependent dehydrogenase (short-subunit alcohol dehydrogenase family)
MKPDNHVALITGAGRGIGRGIAVALATHGWKLGINYRSDHASAGETLTAVEKAGGKGMLLPGDISQVDIHPRLVKEVIETYGRLDLLVNNAGMAPRQRMDVLQTSEASFDEVMAVNLRGPFFLTQRIAQAMLAQGFGMVINIGSISAYTSSLNRPEYCIAKAGLAMMTQLFADRLADSGIPVYEIRPGIIETDMTGPAHQKYDQLIAEGITPMRRWGQPEDIAQAVLALVEGGFPFSPGDIFNVDGGFHMRRL